MSSNKEGCPFLLVTANVGSIFEDPDGLLKIWILEFLKTIENLQPLFIALHCQEVGGKNYETSMKHVKYFVKTLLDSEQLMPYCNVRVFLDEDFTHTENFTALGNLYFIHESLKDVKLFDFESKIFHPVIGREIFSGNIEDVTLKEKAKFPQQLFPECKWSRKGYLRTRWSCENFIFDLTNIHLFHDASNFIAMESFPSQYTVIRQDALQHVLDKFNNDDYESVPMFIFGDFNFRLDMKAVIERLTQDDINHSKGAKNGSSETISFKDPMVEDKTILTLGKKVFDLSDHDKTFLHEQNHKWLLDLDKEVKCFEDQLYEFNIGFPPSYPFTEEATCSSYMKTRCPAWCDRILLNKSAMDLIRDQSSDLLDEVKYDMIGKNVPMGDHKPILLSFKLIAPADQSESINDLDSPASSKALNTLDFGTSLRGSLPHGNDPTSGTRYICIQCGDKEVPVFRETTV
ncbi:inositol polyphosphate-5-phosphatase A isoform X2 [Brevipalpus obovatus]|uniref:inositol polyphosphate-5-phosphatase A isoform X2 n=1 Tax=Brevipalpus obovatus TaxID=246614 RepID=UPI003D9DCD23